MKFLHTVSFIVTCLFLPSQVDAQPESVTLSDCNYSSYNGVYEDSGLLKADAPCYLLESSPHISLELSSTGWMFGTYLESQIPCQDVPFATNLFSSDTEVNITQVEPDFSSSSICGASAVFINNSIVPTLSEWGTIILCLLLTICSVVLIKQQAPSIENKIAD